MIRATVTVKLTDNVWLNHLCGIAKINPMMANIIQRALEISIIHPQKTLVFLPLYKSFISAHQP
jgi:hypothetical protein